MGLNPRQIMNPVKTPTKDPEPLTEIPINFDDTIPIEIAKPDNTTSESNYQNFEQKVFAILGEVKESIKDIQLKIDHMSPVIEKIIKLEKDLLDCNAKCLLLEDDFKILNTKISNLVEQNEQLENDLTASNNKLKNLTARQSKIEADFLTLSEGLKKEFETREKTLEESITKKLSNDVENWKNFVTKPNISDELKLSSNPQNNEKPNAATYSMVTSKPKDTKSSQPTSASPHPPLTAIY